MKDHMMDAAPVRTHVRRLVADGMRQQTIIAAAGVSGAALSLLLHGHYTPGRPPQRTIRAEAGYRLLDVVFEARASRYSSATAQFRCPPSVQFEPAGYRVGRCATCGELAPTRTTGAQLVLVGHPTLDPLEGDEAA